MPTQNGKRLLAKQALRLRILGVMMEWERGRVMALVEEGLAFSSPETLAANKSFNEVAVKWMRLKVEHQALARRLGI